MINPRQILYCSSIVLATSGLLHADLVLETETAELGKKGDALFSQALQFEWQKDGGTGIFTVNQFEYALSDRAEILIEPFFYEWDNPKDGKSFSGVGDLEITPSYMVMLDDENSWIPAAVLAFKLKVPTATNSEIGTGEFDYQPYIILGKTCGNWVFNLNFGYDFVTAPPKESKKNFKNQFIYDFSTEYKVNSKLSIFGEVFANSTPGIGEKGTFAGALATEYKFTDHINAFLSVGYDSDGLLIVRPGFNIEF